MVQGSRQVVVGKKNVVGSLTKGEDIVIDDEGFAMDDKEWQKGDFFTL